MSSLTRLPKLAVLAGTASALALSSCALPPEQAWRKIRTDGLVAYIAYEIKTPRRAIQETTPGGTQPVNGAPGAASRTEALLAKTSPAPAPASSSSGASLSIPVSPTSSPVPVDDGAPVAVAVPSLPGYVRSPFTNPPRLVDVKGATPGSKVVCPYSNKPFIVPMTLAQESSTPAVAEKKEAPARTKAPQVASSEDSAPLPTKTGKVETPAEKSSAPTNSASPKKLASSDKPITPPTEATAPVTPPPPVPAVKPAPEIPYGSPIVGRPGFVNSPYAATHQLVDVTGLPIGMEVKCPYTGKLFRVPPQDMASSKPVETATEKK